MMTTTGFDPELNKWKTFRDGIVAADERHASRGRSGAGENPNPGLASLPKPKPATPKALLEAAARHDRATKIVAGARAALADGVMMVDGAKGDDLRRGLDQLAKLEAAGNRATIAELEAEMVLREEQADAFTATLDGYRPVIETATANLEAVREVKNAAEAEIELLEQVAAEAGGRYGTFLHNRSEARRLGRNADEKLARYRAAAGVE